MKHPELAPPNEIIVLARSKAWASTIRRHLSDSKLSWVLDLDGLEFEISKNRSVAAIVEIPVADIDAICVRLSHLDNNSHNVRLFAIGQKELQFWHPLMRAAGISAWFWSPLQASRLAAVIERQLLAVKPRAVSLESGFKSQLPWANAVDEGFE